MVDEMKLTSTEPLSFFKSFGFSFLFFASTNLDNRATWAHGVLLKVQPLKKDGKIYIVR